MNLKIPKIILIIVILVILVIALPLLGYFVLTGFNQKGNSPHNYPPHLLFLEGFQPSPIVAASQLTNWVNASQGTSFKVNTTFTSLSGQQLSLFVQNLTIRYYSSRVKLGNIATDYFNDYSSLQSSAFNYSLDINPVTLQPTVSNYTIISIDLSRDAPIGQYTIAVSVGVKVLESDGTFKSAESQDSSLEMIVY